MVPGIEWYAGRTVVITGGFGYLGTHVSERLVEVGAAVRRATRGRAGLSAAEAAWSGDLCDSEFARRLADGADAVFHFSGQTSIKTSHDDPIGDMRANVQSTLTLLEACRKSGRKPAFVYAGTATEVGLTVSVPTASDDPDRPITVYDAHKLAAEQLVGTFHDNGWINGTTLRIANVYGPGVAKSAIDRGVTNRMIARALAGQDLTYYGDGLLVRDYVYVDDLIEAFLRAGAAVQNSSRRSYVVGSGAGITLREAFNLIADVAAETGFRRVQVMSMRWPEDTHPIDRRSFVGDIAPLTALCGWLPTLCLRDGIRRTIVHFSSGSNTGR